MANFSIAHKRTARFEGGYVNNQNDAGGETIFGVARKANPNWAGWKLVDAYDKKAKDFVAKINKDEKIKELAEALYKSEYWDKVWGDRIEHQSVANDMYDTAVNMGVATSVKLSEKQFDLKETGVMNEALLTKLNSVA